jgi:hypothetical protein
MAGDLSHEHKRGTSRRINSRQQFSCGQRHRRLHRLDGDIAPRACRSFKQEKHAERLRGLGDSSGDEDGSDAMKRWEIVADNLKKAGWSWGCVSAIGSTGRTIWIANAHRGELF